MNTLEIKPNRPSLPNSFMTADDNKSPLIADFNDTFIKNPGTFQISLKKLEEIIQDGEKRTFSEEIDKLESLGGNSPSFPPLLKFPEKFFELALKTNFTKGISSQEQDLQLREAEYEHNRRSPKPPESSPL